MVSSTDIIRVAASMAPVMALVLTIEGSHTHASKLSAMSSCVMSTPYHFLPGDGRGKNERKNERE